MTEPPLPLTEPWPAEPPAPPRGYLAESFGEFFADPSWWKKTLIGAVVSVVPIFGTFAIQGYALTWLRQTAWGVDRGLPQIDDVWALLTVGGRAFVTALFWSLLGLVIMVPVVGLAVIGGIATSESGSPVLAVVGTLVGVTLGLVALAAFIAVMFLSEIGTFRTTLYESIAAGTSPGGVIALVRRNTGGLVRAIGTTLVTGLIVWVFYAPQYVIELIPTDGSGTSETAMLVLSFAMMPIVGAASFVSAMISSRAFGRWLREIDPRTLPPLDPGVAAANAQRRAASNDPFSDAGEVAPDGA